MPLVRLSLGYASRSLRRGGQRTVLAVFCVAVGVMAVVALRLAGDMVRDSLTGNVREVLGGDVSLQSTALPLSSSGLAPVQELVRQGLATDYVALGAERGSVQGAGGPRSQLQLFVVDPGAHFPLVGRDTVDDPSGRRITDLLATPGTVVLSQLGAQQAATRAGATLQLTLTRGGGGDVTVGGVLPNRIVAGNPYYAFLSRPTYNAIATNPAVRYGIVDLLQPDPSRAAAAATALRTAYPSALVQTVQDALDQNLQVSSSVDQFLEIVGLLALLIGGIGVVNTMQVSLRRRRVEVAMLKAAGYRRRELYGLFGTEAAMLGLAGGVLGSLVGIGVSVLLKTLIERAFFIDITFSVRAVDVLDGLAVGLATALIFGLLPIVRAASVRPAVVLRDTPAAMTTGSAAQSVGLYLLLVLLFAGLAASLIGSLTTAIIVVLVTVVVIGILAGVFWLVVWLVGLVPVPERATPVWALGALLAIGLSLVVGRRLGPVGAALVLVVVLAVSVVVMPRRIKTATKLALRSLRRARGRTATTLVALFIGIVGVGLILVIGSDIRDKVNTALDSLTGYSTYAIASPQDAGATVAATASLPGLQDRRVTTDIGTTPVAVDGAALPVVLPRPGQDPDEAMRRYAGLAGVEGYDLAAGGGPDIGAATQGRALGSGDAGTTNVVVPNSLRGDPVRLHVRSTVTLRQPTSQASVTATVVGFYSSARLNGGSVRIQFFYQPVLADRSLVTALAGPAPNPDLQTSVALQLSPGSKTDALKQLQAAVPRVYILDIGDLATIVSDILSNLVVLLLALASLSVLAGIVIIANTVALAMLERRREIGVLKAVGHSSRSVLAQVLVENGVIAAIGGLAGMATVAVMTRVLADRFFQSGLPVSAGIVVLCVGGLLGLVLAVAALVAWGPTRLRPVEVLRYE